MIRAVVAALAALAATTAAACGVSLEDHPQRIEDPSIQQPDRAPQVSTARPTTSPPPTTSTTVSPPSSSHR